MSSTMISSAVVIPDQQHTEEPPHSPSPSLKRRPSSLSLDNTTNSTTNKRPRLDSTHTNNPSTHSPPLNPPASSSSSPPHRKPSQNTTEEKRRNRRLFGTLLSTLSQTSTAKPNKKRDEIEKRQIERVRRDQEEREEERQRRKRELEVQRGEEWRVWEEESRSVRWRNRRAVAGFLRTETEPRLYWRPWELREGERERVKGQREGVEEEIRREEEEELGLKTEEKVGGGVVERDERKDGDGAANGKMEIDEDDKKEEPSDGQNGDVKEKKVEDAIADAPARADEGTRTPPVEEKPREEDHGGEELVEGHEDDVIY